MWEAACWRKGLKTGRYSASVRYSRQQAASHKVIDDLN
ncbi:hypothetical protein PCH70_42040 [Pseudomonas cichorii JBC1]|nr:hypothetical protein PCH70_42040 [Pseudomonas cichorii JBC1]